ADRTATVGGVPQAVSNDTVAS
ncbi:MAG: hypothetical protein QOK31_1705, partial [Solirubrobacteraceae bacterium]|nr:hypothetical protein [Solirubrobacteraceae bacterium]